MRALLLIILITLSACSTEQKVMRNAKTSIKTLASNDFHGRGYTHQGLQKAEDFLIKKFKKIGLTQVYPNYKQKVTYPINILNTVELKINGKELSFGTDYLINSNAETEEFTQKEIFIIPNALLAHSMVNDKKLFKLLSFNAGKIPVLDYINVNDSLKITLNAFSDYLDQEKTLYDFPALIQIQKKLIHGLAGEQDNFHIVTITENLDENAKIDLKVNANLNSTFETHNIVGKVAGTQNDSAIFVTAHYDHLGTVNDVIFYGANDNASGTSMLLSLAKYFKKYPSKNDVYFYALTGEEAGLQGATTAAEGLPLPKEKIKFVINLDILGTGDDGIQIVNSSIFTKEFELLNQINDEKNLVEQIKKRGESCNSDHCPFYKKGIPAVFIYTLGGISHYHNPFDKAETLPLTDYYDIFLLLTQFIERL